MTEVAPHRASKVLIWAIILLCAVDIGIILLPKWRAIFESPADLLGIMVLVSLLAIAPYLLALLFSRGLVSPRHWTVLAVPLYAVIDLRARIGALLDPYSMDYFLADLFLPFMVAPAVFLGALVGAILWRWANGWGLIGWFALVGLAGFSWYYAFHVADPRRQVRGILKLSELPSSLRGVKCEDHALTDVIVYCYFEVDPAEFDKLLTGWHFEHKVETVRAKDRWESLREDFEATQRWNAQVPEYHHGGWTRLYTDGQRRRVVLDHYVE